MGFFRKVRRGSWLLAMVALFVVCNVAVPHTLAVMIDRAAPLVNTFLPDSRVNESGDVNVHVLKTVRNLGEKVMLPCGFQFALTDTATGRTQTVVSSVNGRANFNLSFTAADVGTHVYTLTEVPGTAPGVTYSELAYEIRVDVALADAMKITVYVDGEETSTPLAVFENLYDSDLDDPETGDRTALAGYAALVVLGGIGLYLLIRKVRKYVA